MYIYIYACICVVKIPYLLLLTAFIANVGLSFILFKSFVNPERVVLTQRIIYTMYSKTFGREKLHV